MKILAICPSNRPDKLPFMMDSFLSTRSEHTQIRVYYQQDSITKILNQAFIDNPDYDFYHLMNDDCIYKTKNWDIKLANKGKISYGDDLFQGENLCTFPMLDGNIVRALGWLQMPTLERYAGDVVWKYIGTQLGILEYHPEVTIRHAWEGADGELNKLDMARFAQWLPWSYKDIAKVRKALSENIS